jgi:hypothetical protein
MMRLVALACALALMGCSKPEIHAWDRIQYDDTYKLELHEYVVVDAPTDRQEALDLLVSYLKQNPIKAKAGYEPQAVFYEVSNDTPVAGQPGGLKLNEQFPGGDGTQTETDVSDQVIATVSWEQDGKAMNINWSNSYRKKGDSYCTTQIAASNEQTDTCTPVADLE